MSFSATRFSLIAIILFAVAALQSCGSARSVVATTASDDNVTQLFGQLTSDYKPWSDIYMPVTLSITSPMEMSISGRATFVRDSEVYLSLRMLGIEVAQVYINNEQIFVVDKFNKRYIGESLSKLPGDVPVNVSNLQDMLLGRVFVPGASAVSADNASDFVLSPGSGQLWTLTPASKIRGADWHFNASRTNPPVLTGISLTLASGNTVECVYSGQQTTVAGLLASALGISAPVGDKELRVSISWNLGDAKWNSGRSVKFSAPGSSYKRVSVESLIKSFKIN